MTYIKNWLYPKSVIFMILPSRLPLADILVTNPERHKIRLNPKGKRAKVKG
jgi:hypothetical protein